MTGTVLRDTSDDTTVERDASTPAARDASHPPAEATVPAVRETALTAREAS